MRECRSQIRVSPFGRTVPGPVVNCVNNFFPSFPSIHRRITDNERRCLSRRGVLCTLTFQPVAGTSAALAHYVCLTCQLQCVLAPYRLGGATGRPRRLGAHVPSLPPAEQHLARHAEGACVVKLPGVVGARLDARGLERCTRLWCWASALLHCFAILCQVS